MKDQYSQVISAADVDAVASREGGEKDPQPWGELNWKITSESMPGTEMTMGICRIAPGERNPLHSHPNCEEILYVLSGKCEHKLGDDMIELNPGDAIRIPQDVPHFAKNIGTDELVAVIVFSTGERRAVNHEGDGAA